MDGPVGTVTRIALAVPTSGPLGLTGPSGTACAVLAAEEVNAAGGVFGRPIELVPVDAGRAPEVVARTVRQLLDAQAIEAVVGYHTSDIHRAIEKVTAGRAPYVFTPPHEGGRREEGVVLLGEDPVRQLRPVVERFGQRPWFQRWALIGNDYIWPWFVHRTADDLFRRAGAEVVMQQFVPFGQVDPEQLIDQIRRTRTQAVLLSLVGRDLATFNRSFATSPLRESVLRVSGSLEEAGLLEAGGDDTGELYGAMRWFASDVGGTEFAERYLRRWGPSAPAIGAYARGCYEGVHALVSDARCTDAVRQIRPTAARARVKLARADGLELAVVS